MPSHAPSLHVILSGCSGGGKSTLLEELARRGFAAVPEPGRRIVAAKLHGDGAALPWHDLAAFAQRALAMATQDRAAVASASGWVFFDRGQVDAAVALEHATGQPLRERLRGLRPFDGRVFLTPPRPQIHRTDAARRHGLDEATLEYDRLLRAYAGLGYEPVFLPRVPVAERADVVTGFRG